MTRVLTLIALLGLAGMIFPAHAGRLPFCDDIKDDKERMTCLQQHISYLEQTVLRLQGDVAELTKNLDKMANTASVYKLQSISLGKCLGIGGQQQQNTAMVSCDRPDSWKLILGGQTPPKKEKPADQATATQAPAAPAAPDADADKPKKKGKKKQQGQEAAAPNAAKQTEAPDASAVKKSAPSPAATGQ